MSAQTENELTGGQPVKNETFLWYGSNFKIISALPQEVRGQVVMAIIEYGAGREIRNPIVQIEGRNVDLRRILRHIFDSIDAEKRRYANKTKINDTKDRLMRMMGGSLHGTGMIESEIEQSIKDLKKLAVEVNRHDIRNINQRIEEVWPKGYMRFLLNHIDDYEKKRLVADYFKWLKENNYLTLPEFDQLKELVNKAEINYKSVQEMIKNKNKPLVRRDDKNGKGS